MTHISPRDVASDVSDYELKHGETLDCDRKKLVAAISILGRFFGGDWLDSRIAYVEGMKSTFIHPPNVGRLDEFRTQARIGDLAEHLVNLQEVDGFDSCLIEIRSDSIETGLAKLIAAGMLRRRNIPFRFVVPSGRAGQDYDAEAIIGAATVAIEMKAKVEGKGKGPTSGAIADSLKRARKQFPTNTPNLVFLRVPGSWGQAEKGRIAMAAGVLKEFRASRTIGAVVVHWERWLQSSTADQPEGAERRDRLLVMVSGRARVELTALESALQVEDTDDLSWLPLHALLCPDASDPRAPRLPSDSRFDLGNLTILGPVVMKYAHLCARCFLDPMLPTWEGIRQTIHMPRNAPNRLPEDCILVIRLEERPGRAGKRILTVPFFKEGGSGNAIARETEIEFFEVVKGMPPVACLTLPVGSWDLQGPGIYYFDFLIGDQFLGRMPISVYTDEMPSERVNRGPLRGEFVSLEYGHMVENVTASNLGKPDFALTFQRVIEAVPLLESSAFALSPSVLVLGLSARGDFPAQHALTVQPRDRQENELIPAVAMDVVLQKRLPGELFWTQAFQLSEKLVYPGAGDYEFLISVDGKVVGTVDLPVRANTA